jgi:hypothetical protein
MVSSNKSTGQYLHSLSTSMINLGRFKDGENEGRMNTKAIIGVSILAVVLVILSCQTSVVGYRIVKDSQENLIKESESKIDKIKNSLLTLKSLFSIGKQSKYYSQLSISSSQILSFVKSRVVQKILFNLETKQNQSHLTQLVEPPSLLVRLLEWFFIAIVLWIPASLVICTFGTWVLTVSFIALFIAAGLAFLIPITPIIMLFACIILSFLWPFFWTIEFALGWYIGYPGTSSRKQVSKWLEKAS